MEKNLTKMEELMITINKMVKEPDFKRGFDTHGVWTYFYTYQSKNIAQVGQVTKDFWSWQAVYYCLDSYLDVQADEGYPNRKGTLKYLASVLEIQFKWLVKEVELGTKYKAPMKPDFVSPLITYQPEDAPMVEAICPSAITEGIEAAKHMYFKAPSAKVMSVPHEVKDGELLSIQNLMAFCRVMEKAGRLSQEGTIDSTKTAEPPTIELIEEMEKVALKSRRGDFGIQLDFDKKAVDIKCNDFKSYIEKGRYYMADMLDVMRISAIRRAIPKETADKLFSLEQKLDTKELGNAGDYAGIIQLCMERFRTLRDCQKADMAAARKEAGKNEERMAAAEGNIKELSRGVYAALTNMLVGAFDKRLSNIERVKKVLSVTLHNMGKDAKRPSSFVGIIMAEEFMEYILSKVEDNDLDYNLRYTHDELEPGCEVEDGEVLEFKDGLVAGRNIYTADVKAIPDGKYTVRKENGRIWVEAPIVDRIHQRIAERPQGNKLVFQTRGVSNLKAVKAAIEGAKKVVLVPYAVMDGKKISDAVIADGKVVCQFICKVGEDHAIDKRINNLYRNKYGVVTYCHPVSYAKGKSSENALLVALDEVKLMTASEVAKAVQEAQAAPVFEKAPEKKPFKSQATSRLNNMAALMAEDEEPVAAPAPAPKAEVKVAGGFQAKGASLTDLLMKKKAMNS